MVVITMAPLVSVTTVHFTDARSEDVTSFYPYHTQHTFHAYRCGTCTPDQGVCGDPIGKRWSLCVQLNRMLHHPHKHNQPCPDAVQVKWFVRNSCIGYACSSNLLGASSEQDNVNRTYLGSHFSRIAASYPAL
ncbi:hypothetical protein BKA64DRAFT_234694 [Cadophora sp. MPI-SDFR-AT-0126]|nr:hypothetical protein BKA64DRAFT_234694 [Leotiomycetes sp. MPI-SDFR-AT-0126]